MALWLSLGRSIGCAAHNFWRLCEIDKANNVVYKNRPCETKILRRGLFFSGVVLHNRFLRLLTVLGFVLLS